MPSPHRRYLSLMKLDASPLIDAVPNTEYNGRGCYEMVFIHKRRSGSRVSPAFIQQRRLNRKNPVISLSRVASAGARSVPIRFDATPEELGPILDGVNGLLFPGGTPPPTDGAR